MPEEEGNGSEVPSRGALVCTNCSAANDPASDFCHKCGCPIGAMTTIDPLKRIYAQGFWFRRAASGRVPPIVFWGTWLLFGPSIALAAILGLFVVCSPHFDRSEISDWYGPTIIAAGVLLSSAFLYKMTRNYLGRDRTGEAATGEPADED